VAPELSAAIERAMSRDPQWRFGSAHAMRAALAGRSEAPVANRPPTKVLAAPLPDPSTLMVAPSVRRSRTRVLLGLAAACAAVVIAAAAAIAESTTRTPVPEPASTSTSVPVPLSTSIAPPPPPPTTPVQLDQGNPRKGPPDHANGNGPRKPKKGGEGGDG
jgi:serine/threonine-protein kinase